MLTSQGRSVRVGRPGSRPDSGDATGTGVRDKVFWARHRQDPPQK